MQAGEAQPLASLGTPRNPGFSLCTLSQGPPQHGALHITHRLPLA